MSLSLAGYRILFASPFSLLDTSSGAAIDGQLMLRDLAARGAQVQALTASVFDSAQGGLRVRQAMQQQPGARRYRLEHEGVPHTLIPTRSHVRSEMTAEEEIGFFDTYCNLLAGWRPHLVMGYGGLLLERALIREARAQGAATVFYLVNAAYHDGSPFRDVDLVLTDSRRTAELYKERMGLHTQPLGKFIDPIFCVAPERTPRFVTFINPSLEKGGALFAAMALQAKISLPQAEFLVVESRGTWAGLLQALGLEANQFSNVKVTPNRSDMRAVYAQTRVVVVPSVGHESSGRVVPEAFLNGIPVLASDSGGLPETVGHGGFVVPLKAQQREQPTVLPQAQDIAPWLQRLEALLNDPAIYEQACARARTAGEQHRLGDAMDRLQEAIMPLLLHAAKGNPPVL